MSAVHMIDVAGQPCRVLAQGARALNTVGAMQLAQAIDLTVPVGSAELAGLVDGGSTIAGQNTVWGDFSLSSAFSASPSVLATTK